MNDDEYTAFFATMHPALLRYGMRRLDAPTANDVAIDTLRIVWQKDLPAPKSDDERGQLIGLTYAIMNGLINNSRRTARRRTRLMEALKAEQVHPSASPDLADHLSRRRVPPALSQLSAVDQQVVLLLIDGYAVSEIASLLGYSPGAVSTRLGRARAKLRSLLDADA